MDKEKNEKKYKNNRGIFIKDRWLLKSFVENLQKEGYTIKRLLDDYVYIGGSGYYSNDHTNINNVSGFVSTPQYNHYTRYWKDYISLQEIHEKRPNNYKCICGHDIKENCWLMNTLNKDIASVIGNCCIKNFLPELKIKHCNLCNTPHKRVVYDICFDCEKKKKTLAKNRKIKEKAKLKKYKYMWKL